MTNKGIALIGIMGAGKTLVSKRLGELLNREVVSTDQTIIDREGMSIEEIFDQKGEDYFRALEKEVVGSVCRQENIIIDCGGGVIKDPENFQNLKNNCAVFYLKATPEYIYENIKDHTHRPLLKVDDPLAEIGKILKERAPLYEQAEFTVNANQSIEKIAEDIMEIINDRD